MTNQTNMVKVLNTNGEIYDVPKEIAHKYWKKGEFDWNIGGKEYNYVANYDVSRLFAPEYQTFNNIITIIFIIGVVGFILYTGCGMLVFTAWLLWKAVH